MSGLTIQQFDDVDLPRIPSWAAAVACYVDGSWPYFNQLAHLWPHAYRSSIATSAAHDADALDIENGDAVTSEAPGWTRRQHARGLRSPKLYTSASNVQNLIDTMTAAGIPRDQYLVWSAHYTHTSHICSPNTCGYPKVDMTQWTSSALGGNLDESLCWAYCFGSTLAPPSLTGQLDVREAAAAKKYFAMETQPHLHTHAALAAQLGVLVGLRQDVWRAAEKGIGPDGKPTPIGWDIRKRRPRYALLGSYTHWAP